MQIHELLPRKKVNEGFGDFFGLNNPKVKEVWNELGAEMVQDLSARFTSDPRYANMNFAQRKMAIMRDEFLQDTSQKSLDAWNSYLEQIQIRNGAELTDQQYQNSLLAWANRGMFNGRYNELGPEAKQTAIEHFTAITKNRKDPKKIKDTFASLVADETARVVQVATDLKAQAQAQANLQTARGASQPTAPGAPITPSGAAAPGLPGPAEMAKFDALVAKAAKEQG
jgi:hypothetical protein